ncbi:hypothetical protein [Streptomyces sp. NPDC047841]|uniref:iron-sulfur cluster-binding protein n=1 Tax=Streptomyces sp. NPDC047841 TaxID=3154708 RepID=UPI0034573608
MTRPPHHRAGRENGTVLLRTDHSHYTSVEVAAPHLADRIGPGQFVSVPAPHGFGPPGRWMFSAAAVRHDAGDTSALRLVARRGGNGLGALDHLRAGDTLPLIGPLGTPLHLPGADDTTVVIGVDHGASAALLTAEALHTDGRSTRLHLFAPEPVEETAAPWLEPPPRVAARAEATPGPREWPRRVAALTDGAGRAVIAAPTPLAHAAFQVCREREVPCWVLVEPFMACGIGVCLTCAVPLATEDTYLRACVDGPVFPADRLAWERILPAGRPA